MGIVVFGLILETATVMIVVLILSMLFRYGRLHYVKDLLIAFSFYLALLCLSIVDVSFELPIIVNVIQYYFLTIVAFFVYRSGKRQGAKFEDQKLMLLFGGIIIVVPVLLMLTGYSDYIEGFGYINLGITFVLNGIRWLLGRIEVSPVAKVVGGAFVVYGLHLMDFMFFQYEDQLIFYGLLLAVIIEIFLACSLVLLNFISLHNASNMASEKYKQLFDNSSDAILLTDKDVIFNCNDQALKMFECSKSEIVGLTLIELSTEYQENGKHSVEYGEELFVNAQKGNVTRFDWVHQSINGKKIQCEVALFVINGNQFAAVIRDMSDKYAFEEALNFHMFYDSLTHLPKRDFFIDRLSLYLDDRYKKVALIALNIDNFKEINDQYGHIVGDEVLKEVARRVERVFNKEINLTRLGSDEFVVMLDRLQHVNQIYMPIERIKSTFSESFFVADNTIDITVCMGVAFPETSETLALDLLKNVDLALNLAKKNGRDKLEFYSEVGKNTFTERINLEKAIRLGIQQREFKPYYQPIIDSLTGKIIGAEALARWHREDGTLGYPSVFIPIAEETELIGLLGEQILEQACRDCKLFLNYSEDFIVHVNLSIKQIYDDQIVDKISSLLEECELTARHLQVELTESAFMEDTSHTHKIIECIRSLGVGIALDDFGTGYSSLSYLTDMKVDTIKIDRTFVVKLPRDPKASALLTFLSQLIHDLGYKIVVEGVEEQDQLDFLVGLGCDYIQGYYYYRPMTFDKLVETLSK